MAAMLAGGECAVLSHRPSPATPAAQPRPAFESSQKHSHPTTEKHNTSIATVRRKAFHDLGVTAMSKDRRSFGATLMAGILVVAPVYLGGLLVLKATMSLAGLLKPVTALLPRWLPGSQILSLLLLLAICFLVGVAIGTSAGREIEKRIERSLFEKIPGYTLFRSLTQRLVGESQDEAWKPALAEIEDALVPAFIIEQHADGRYTVFVPSVPTPFAGSVYVLTADRVHPLNVAFTQALRAVSRWGMGCKDLVAAMKGAKDGAASARSVLAKYTEPTVSH